MWTADRLADAQIEYAIAAFLTVRIAACGSNGWVRRWGRGEECEPGRGRRGGEGGSRVKSNVNVAVRETGALQGVGTRDDVHPAARAHALERASMPQRT